MKSETEAKSFLSKLSKRDPTDVEERRQSTDYREECCNEGCKVREIMNIAGCKVDIISHIQV